MNAITEPKEIDYIKAAIKALKAELCGDTADALLGSDAAVSIIMDDLLIGCLAFDAGDFSLLRDNQAQVFMTLRHNLIKFGKQQCAEEVFDHA